MSQAEEQQVQLHPGGRDLGTSMWMEQAAEGERAPSIGSPGSHAVLRRGSPPEDPEESLEGAAQWIMDEGGRPEAAAVGGQKEMTRQAGVGGGIGKERPEVPGPCWEHSEQLGSRQGEA